MSSYIAGGFAGPRLEYVTVAGWISYPVMRCFKKTSNSRSDANMSRDQVQVKSLTPAGSIAARRSPNRRPGQMTVAGRTGDLLELGITGHYGAVLVSRRLQKPKCCVHRSNRSNCSVRMGAGGLQAVGRCA
jgi:hypothetical protein